MRLSVSFCIFVRAFVDACVHVWVRVYVYVRMCV